MKTILVTGATDGIGKATAAVLASQGHRVIIHGRNRPRVEAALGELANRAPAGRVEGISFDLGRFSSVRDGAAELRALLGEGGLDVLINNAGIFASEREVTGDGCELTLQVNHLSPVLLTELLLPAMRGRAPAAGPARVINVASIAHTRGEIHRADLTLAANFTGYIAYAQSKLANVLHVRGLAAAYAPSELRAYALHPGVISTKLLAAGFGARGADVAHGAATSVWLATASEDQLAGSPSGSYVSEKQATKPANAALDDEVRDWLWAASRDLVALAPQPLVPRAL